MVSGAGSCDITCNQWGHLLMLDGVQDGEYAGQGSVWTAFDLGKSCVRQIEIGKALHRNPVEPCRAPQPIQDGRAVGYVSYYAWLCGYLGVVSATFLVDGLHWSHWYLRRICQSFEGMVPGGSRLRWWFQVVPISCRRCLNYRIFVCGTLKRLAPSVVLKPVCRTPIALSLSKMVRP